MGVRGSSIIKEKPNSHHTKVNSSAILPPILNDVATSLESSLSRARNFFSQKRHSRNTSKYKSGHLGNDTRLWNHHAKKACWWNVNEERLKRLHHSMLLHFHFDELFFLVQPDLLILSLCSSSKCCCCCYVVITLVIRCIRVSNSSHSTIRFWKAKRIADF